MASTRSATAARAWSRSTASVCWRHRAAARRARHGGADVERARAQVAAAGARAAAGRHARDRATRAATKSTSGPSGSKVGKPRFAPRAEVVADASHPAIAVNLNACIQCTRCVRACRDEQVNDVIGLALRGEHAKIVFDMDDPMGASTCVACGECVQACPTGALMPAREAALAVPDKQVDSVCPYCGVGCQLTYNVKDNKILFVERPRRPGQPQPAVRQGPLRLRLRAPSAAPDQAADPPRRRAQARRLHDGPRRLMRVFREATWDEALDLAGGTLQAPARPARPLRARRLRLGQGQQRRGLPVPEAGAHRLRQQQRRPLHAAVPRLQRGGAARRHRLGRGEQPGDRRDAGRGGDPDRRQPDGEPSGGRHLDEKRRRRRHQADRDATRAAASSRATRSATCSSRPTPTWRCSTR